MKTESIMIVDDVDINRSILRQFFEEKYNIIEASNGKEALVKMVANHKALVAILLDIVMPVMDGFQFLEVLKTKDLVGRIPIILITGEDSSELELKGYDIGVADYIRKPFNVQVIRKRVDNLVRLYQYELQLQNQLWKQGQLLRAQEKQLLEMNNALIETLSNVVEFRNMESGRHVRRVKKYTRCLAECIREHYPEYELTEEDMDIIENTAALHDVGKIAIPDRILLKPDKLTKEEFEIMKSHTVHGGDIIEQSLAFKDKAYMQYAYDIARHHHERYDGSGYPDGLEGEAIPIAAQMVSIADVYDALVNERVYKSAEDPEKAYQMIISGECGAFSPKIIASFQMTKDAFEEIAAHYKEEKEE